MQMDGQTLKIYDCHPRTLSSALPGPIALGSSILSALCGSKVLFILEDLILTGYCNRTAVGPQSLRGIPNGYSSQQQIPQNRSVSGRLPPTGKMGMGP